MFSERVKTVLIACLLCIQTIGIRASVTLAWDPSPDTNVAGYYLCYGLNSGNYTITNTLSGPITNSVVSGLETGKVYFFAVAAYSADGLMSDFSNEVTYTNSPPVTPPNLAPPGPGLPPLPPPLAQQLDTNALSQPGSGTVSGNTTTPSLTASNKQVLIVGIPPSVYIVATNGGMAYAVWGTVGSDLVVQTTTNYFNPNSWVDVTNIVLTNAAQFGDGSTPAPVPQDALEHAFIPAAETHDFPFLSGADVNFYRVKVPYSYPILADKVLKSKGYATRLVVIRQPADTIHDVCHVAQEQGYIECSDVDYVLTLQRCGSTIREIANTYSDSISMNWTTASEFIYTNGMRQVTATVVKTDPPELDPTPSSKTVKTANIVIDF